MEIPNIEVLYRVMAKKSSKKGLASASKKTKTKVARKGRKT
jgi:hypothetical protein